ncbi:hypothetical protein [Lampropedia aestuarii]|uniref:hypothetical protein n=1 Tax=Lampropedia aestuarii TaxID=2562762 RepID=UPI0024691E85|nr:hypothetical protein [Lampropedia aestuarii]MDH5857358.1 hypothetical protein [Lampropedia aestuarii]
MKRKIHQIFKQTCVSLLFFTFTGAIYAQCSAPKFEPLRYAQDSVNTDSWISLSVGPSLASLSIPSGFTSISITEEGSLIFSKDEKTELRGIIIFEKLATTKKIQILPKIFNLLQKNVYRTR